MNGQLGARANDRGNLALNGINNPSDRFGEALKHFPSRVPLERLDFAELYKSGDLYIHLCIGALPEKPQGELLFQAVPTVGVEANQTTRPPELIQGGSSGGTQDDGMFACVRHLIQSDKTVIASGVTVPSRVWLKAPEKVVQNRRIFSISMGELGVEVIGVGDPGEIGVLNWGRSSNSKDCGVGSVIQGVFEVPDGVTGELAQSIRNFGYGNLYEYVSALQVVLLDKRIGVSSEVSLSAGVKLLSIFTSPSNQVAGAREINGC